MKDTRKGTRRYPSVWHEAMIEDWRRATELTKLAYEDLKRIAREQTIVFPIPDYRYMDEKEVASMVADAAIRTMYRDLARISDKTLVSLFELYNNMRAGVSKDFGAISMEEHTSLGFRISVSLELDAVIDEIGKTIQSRGISQAYLYKNGQGSPRVVIAIAIFYMSRFMSN